MPEPIAGRSCSCRDRKTTGHCLLFQPGQTRGPDSHWKEFQKRHHHVSCETTRSHRNSRGPEIHFSHKVERNRSNANQPSMSVAATTSIDLERTTRSHG